MTTAFTSTMLIVERIIPLNNWTIYQPPAAPAKNWSMPMGATPRWRT